MATNWKIYCSKLLRYEDLGITLDTSCMAFDDNFHREMASGIQRAISDMKALEAGGIANPDEGRMVGHYWLRNSALAPAGLKEEIDRDLADIKAFAAAVHSGEISAPNGKKFSTVLVIGIGGSALGPQLVADALVAPGAPMEIAFFDNTDPAGMQKVFASLGAKLATTLVVVISKSGGTAETRNGMVETEAAFARAGLDFPKHAVAVTGVDSKLDKHAVANGWMKRFPMADWIGGRTSVMSVVGLVPAALQGVDLDMFLGGAKAMDEKTRNADASQNFSMQLALMWYHTGKGKGAKDMVVLPYKDGLVLFSKYLQQLVMESLGKEKDLDGKVVNQGIAVYGNKGSTDQHAYVQQLRDGVNNFFATFVEVREGGSEHVVEVEPGATSVDFLQGFLRGTRKALAESGRESITISIPRVDAYYLGMLIAVFERAVSFYASLVNVNAYHQPGVEAGKKAAAGFLNVLGEAKNFLKENDGKALTADAIAAGISADPEDVYHALVHAAANNKMFQHVMAANPSQDTFQFC